MLRKLLSPSNSPELGSEILNELDSIIVSLFSRYSDTRDCDQFMLTYFITKVSQMYHCLFIVHFSFNFIVVTLMKIS